MKRNSTNMTALKALNIAALYSRYQHLRSAVSVIVFMGTPHRGAGLATIVNNLAHMLPGIRTQLLADLKSNCETLINLSEGFRHEKIEILTFYESRSTNGVVVSHTCLEREKHEVSTNPALL